MNDLDESTLAPLLRELARATKQVLSCVDDLMPGIRHMPVQDYHRLNEAPGRAAAAVDAACRALEHGIGRHTFTLRRESDSLTACRVAVYKCSCGQELSTPVESPSEGLLTDLRVHAGAQYVRHLREVLPEARRSWIPQ